MRRVAIICLVGVCALMPAFCASARVADHSTTRTHAVQGWTTIDLSRVARTQANDSWALPETENVHFVCSRNPVYVPHVLSIWGGNRVTIRGCVLRTPSGEAAYPHNQRTSLSIQSVDFTSTTGVFRQGIQLQEPGHTSVRFTNILIGSLLRGSYSTNHAECVQTWSGPWRFIVDGFQCSTTYQGFFLLPNQWDHTTVEQRWSLSNVEVQGRGAYDFWLGDFGPKWASRPDLVLHDVYDCGPGEPRLSADQRYKEWDGTGRGGSGGNGPAWQALKSCHAGIEPMVRRAPDDVVVGASA